VLYMPYIINKDNSQIPYHISRLFYIVQKSVHTNWQSCCS